ncbi:hypothetical protein LUZ62_023318 [Rhynchospora pubera]|uniref:DUF599 domain-containing protein n=1 Tax=Rhynchospora pubera TaxID=906938 RepID=A0AAV8G0A1_9POAL|nr:hypothetical protein LUZ62_050375 [Rhynchospora pubera]KAJ4810752.1 hypothetical protein LUZ62_023318 [Rhynchospora pubera]
MGWETNWCVDMILVPLGFLMCVSYHLWLWQKIRTQPHQTYVGLKSTAQRAWVLTMTKDNNKKDMIAVQSVRNALMGSTLMASTSIVLSTGLAALLSSTYSIKKPLNSTIYGSHDEHVAAIKYVCLLTIFLFAFLCYSLSIRFFGQFGFLVNVPRSNEDENNPVTLEYVCVLLGKGFGLNTVGNRLFFAGIPLLLWIVGPILVFLCYVCMTVILYNVDVVTYNGKTGSRELGDQNCVTAIV